MNELERFKNAIPASALLRFRDTNTEYGSTPNSAIPGVCLTSMSLFTVDMGSYYGEKDCVSGDKLLVVRFKSDGTIEATTMVPDGWANEYLDLLPLIPSLKMAATLLTDIASGGQHITLTDDIGDSGHKKGG